MVTAAHVVSTKKFKMVQNQLAFDVVVDRQIFLTPNGQTKVPLDYTTVDVDLRESSTDLAFIHTHTNPPCWIPLGNSATTETGDHLLSIGFPGFDNGNPILYEGFLSGRFKHPPIPSAQFNGQLVIPQYEVLKVQMPITSGASGSPVIDDSGHAIGVISEAPMIWTEELESITHAAGSSSGVRISGFDAVKILGQLAIVVREFETTGSGYAVPVSDLKPMRGADHPRSTPAR
jgi:S1-C subfamily serine protease